MSPIPHALRHTFTGSPGGTTILYLHGFMGCKEDWGEVAALTGGPYLAVDLPGHGSVSEPTITYSDHEFTMPGAASLVIALLDRLRTATCCPVGYSMGARLALYLAVHHPERVSGAIIESGSFGLRTESERSERRREDELIAQRLESEPLDSFLTWWHSRPLFATLDQSSTRFKALLERRERGDRKHLAKALRGMGLGSQASLWDRLTTVDRPMLFVAGERDEKYAGLAREMAALCPRGQAAIIPRAGHNVHFEQPDAFGAVVTSFLSEI